MKSIRVWTITLLLVGSSLRAQEAASSAAPPPLAEMQGYQLTESELENIIELLPEQSRRQLTTDEAKAGLIRSWMELMAFYREAQSLQLDHEKEFQERLDFYRKQLLAEEMRNRLTSQVQISEAELQSHYEANREQFKTPPRIHVSHILVQSEAEAQEIKQKMEEGGNFEALAKEYTTDAGGKETGGVLGWVSAGHLVPEFEQVAFSLEPGVVSSPVKTQFGWHLIRVSERKEAGYSDFEEVRDPLREQLLAQKQKDRLDDATKELVAKYGVKLYQEDAQSPN